MRSSRPKTGTSKRAARSSAVRRVQNLLAQAPAAIAFLSGPEHRCTYVNEHYIRITGRKSVSDFVGKTPREALPELDDLYFNLLDEVYRTGKPYSGREMKVTLNRGVNGQPAEAYFDFVYQPILDSKGAVEGILIHAVEVTDTVLARQRIEADSERLRLAQAAAEIGAWEWDPVNRTQTITHELHRLFGTDLNDPDYVQKWASRVHPEDWPKVERFMAEGTQDGGMEFEYRYQHPQLGLRWFYCKGSKLPGRESLLGIVQDVTERKHSQEIIRQSAEQFQGLANAIPQLVWMANADGWIFWYNRQWYDFTGTTPQQMEGWGWQSVHDPAMLPAVMERWRTSIATGQPFEMRFPLRGADGRYRPFLTRGVPIRDAAGKVTRWFGTNTEVSPEVEIQEQLRENEERLRAALIASQRLSAIVSSSDDAIVSKDLNGIVGTWNAAAERIFGYTAEEMIGQPITKIIPLELHSDEEKILSTIARGERIQHFETVRVTKSGERIEVSLTISPVRDDSGRIIGAAKIARDITQHKKAERALHTAERLASVGRLAATVAHEINNPLEALTNLIFLAKASAQGDTRAYLEAAEGELERVSSLARQTLGFYRETRGATSMRIGSQVESLVAVFSSRAGRNGIEICSEIRDDPEVQAVPSEIRQVIANLLSNSMDAVGSAGMIRVRVSRTGAWRGNGCKGVRLTIADSGPGIPPEHLSQLFEPFFTTKKDTGTGLGLWVCKSIVEKHGGSIRVRSSSTPGKSWTVFSVFFPLIAESAEAREGATTAA